MLGRRRRRWANIGPTLGRCVVFAGYESPPRPVGELDRVLRDRPRASFPRRSSPLPSFLHSSSSALPGRWVHLPDGSSHLHRRDVALILLPSFFFFFWLDLVQHHSEGRELSICRKRDGENFFRWGHGCLHLLSILKETSLALEMSSSPSSLGSPLALPLTHQLL